MSELDRLNELLPELFLRIELGEKEAKGFHGCIHLIDTEAYIIDQTNILQFFGYKLCHKTANDLTAYDFQLMWLL